MEVFKSALVSPLLVRGYPLGQRGFQPGKAVVNHMKIGHYPDQGVTQLQITDSVIRICGVVALAQGREGSQRGSNLSFILLQSPQNRSDLLGIRENRASRLVKLQVQERRCRIQSRRQAGFRLWVGRVQNDSGGSLQAGILLCARGGIPHVLDCRQQQPDQNPDD